jgi:hypothetical protein
MSSEQRFCMKEPHPFTESGIDLLCRLELHVLRLWSTDAGVSERFDILADVVVQVIDFRRCPMRYGLR